MADNARMSNEGLRALLCKAFKHSGWQWVIIGIVNACAILNYLEKVPSLYLIYPIGGFELAIRCFFSDIIAYSEVTGRNVPVVWWIIAFLFPFPALLYLYLFPFDKERDTTIQQRLDIAFAVSCALYWTIPALIRLLER
jgi:hypothetical protein